MTRDEYFQFHEAMTKKMTAITKAKNADYTGAAGDDPFANFNRVDSLGVCSTEQGFMVRMLDKYMRINSFVQKGFLNVKDESVEDTLLDLANYCLLFAGYLRSVKDDKNKKVEAGPTSKGPLEAYIEEHKEKKEHQAKGTEIKGRAKHSKSRKSETVAPIACALP